MGTHDPASEDTQLATRARKQNAMPEVQLVDWSAHPVCAVSAACCLRT